MAKDFKKSKSVIAEAKAAESILAKQYEIRALPMNVIDAYIDNNEDVDNVDDLITSMNDNGFTDPIEVTNFGCKEGRYMILSGHRRFAAWGKLHNNKQPINCIIVDASKFKDDNDVKNYVLMANSQRDSAKDPLLFVRRYKEHEALLQRQNFDGNIREEVAKRLGLSVKQADRYKALAKLIPEIQQKIVDEQIGSSSAMPIAPLSEADQKKFNKILDDAIADDANLTRDYVNKMVKYFKAEIWSWDAIKAQIRQESIPTTSNVGSAPVNAPLVDNSSKNRNAEVRRESDPIAAEADKDDEQKEAFEKEQSESFMNAPEEEKSDEELSAKSDEDEEAEAKNASDAIRLLRKVNTFFSTKHFNVEDKKSSLELVDEALYYLNEFKKEISSK